MTNLKTIDVAIIGGGWTGLLTAKEITAKTSLSVAAFERGGPRKLPDYAVTMDELDYNIRLRMMGTETPTLPGLFQSATCAFGLGWTAARTR